MTGAKCQAGHLTLMSKPKQCDTCGKDLEYFRPAVIVGGEEIMPARTMKCICDCEKARIEKAIKLKEEEKAKAKLIEKYKAAKIPPRYADFNFKNIVLEGQKEIAINYCDNFELNRLAGLGMFFIGSKGTGKTTLAICMLKDLLSKGYSAVCMNFSEILDRLFIATDYKTTKSKSEVLEEIMQFDFIILDDFGREAYSPKMLELAFLFVDALNKQKKCIVITANPEMITLLKDRKRFAYAEQFGAILDRLDECCQRTVEFEGISKRRNEQ